MNETDTKKEDSEWNNYLSNSDFESDFDFLILKLEIIFLSLLFISYIAFIVSAHVGNYQIAGVSAMILALCVKWLKNDIGI